MMDININAKNNDIFIHDDVGAAIQELDMLFNTEQTELIGDVNYGTNWWNYLWTLTPLESDMTNYIYTKINETYYASRMSPNVQVQFDRGTENSIYYVKITLTDPRTGNVATVQQYELK